MRESCSSLRWTSERVSKTTADGAVGGDAVARLKVTTDLIEAVIRESVILDENDEEDEDSYDTPRGGGDGPDDDESDDRSYAGDSRRRSLAGDEKGGTLPGPSSRTVRPRRSRSVTGEECAQFRVISRTAAL